MHIANYNFHLNFRFIKDLLCLKVKTLNHSTDLKLRVDYIHIMCIVDCLKLLISLSAVETPH